MNIRGIQKTSLVDFPGRISTVIFFGGCNFLCRFCHNPDLVRDYGRLASYSYADVLEILRKRSSIIDAVVITGGEPTLDKDIAAFLHKIKEIKLFIKLDTNGSNPGVIRDLLSLNLLDYIAIDIKTSPGKYALLTGSDVNFSNIKETIDLVKKTGIDFELRTTCIPGFVTLEDFKRVKAEIGSVKKYYLQQFRNKTTLDPLLLECRPYSTAELNEFCEFVKTFSDICEIRGL